MRWVGILKPLPRARGPVRRYLLGVEPAPVYYCPGHIRQAIAKVRIP